MHDNVQIRVCVAILALIPAACVSTEASHLVVHSHPVEASQSPVSVGLTSLGIIELTSADYRFGGISGLRWRSGWLFAVTDRGNWIRFKPSEERTRLSGIDNAQIGTLLDTLGEPLLAKSRGDAEALAVDGDGWLVAFEHDHRVWRYSSFLLPAVESGVAPDALGRLGANEGIEALATNERAVLLCAERRTPPDNCVEAGKSDSRAFAVTPPSTLETLGAVITDADADTRGTLYFLFRSYSAERGVAAGVVARSANGNITLLGLLTDQSVVDNMEGIAVRENDNRTFLYLISDNNFSDRQRTLLMKFEVVNAGSL